MRYWINTLGAAGAATAAVYMLVAADGGVLYSNPIACVSIALIGLGLCKMGRENERGEGSHQPA